MKEQPSAGGSYVRHKDGTLKRAEEVETPKTEQPQRPPRTPRASSKEH